MLIGTVHKFLLIQTRLKVSVQSYKVSTVFELQIPRFWHFWFNPIKRLWEAGEGSGFHTIGQSFKGTSRRLCVQCCFQKSKCKN